MSEKNIQVYSYRWIVLLLFMLTNITLQILWISFAPVRSLAATFYDVDGLLIDLLTLTFMIVYIPVAFLSAWIIDKYGFKIGSGIGALIAGIFGLLRFFAFEDYLLVLLFQIGIGVGQPFLLNAVTKLSANWFPEDERTTSTGLGLISQFLGIALGMFITPFLVVGNFLLPMLLTYGILSLITGILYVVFVKDKPPTPPSDKPIEEKVLMSEGLKQLFNNKQFIVLFVLFFLGLGIFNTVTTYIEGISVGKGYDEDFAGILGGLMLIGGIVGSLVMSTISDKYNKRKILLIISIAIAAISLSVITFTTVDYLLNIFGFLLGFGLLSAGPVGLEYAVDLTEPVPEASSNGMLLMVGQIGGILLILFLEEVKIGLDYWPALLIQSILLFIGLLLCFFLKEPESPN
ncbi:MAG: MFS transporter [Promethearchaeota archaeon]|nr:MAG: MFS transporter [Candidatus Lokiarchaeota archaeon]